MSLRKGMIFLSIFFLISLWPGINSVSEAQPFTYVPNFDDGTVSVIDTETDTVISTVTVAGEPTSVAAHPDGNRVYVTHGQAGGNIISLIDPFTNTTVSTFSSGGINPVGAAVHPDGTRLYVTNSDDGTLTVIDTATHQVTATVRGMNSPLGVAVHPDGTRVYVANNGIGQPVSVIDAATNTVIATVVMGNPTLLSVLPNGSKLYVTNTNDGQVSIVDTTANTVRATISVGHEPCGVASHPDGTRVYVGNLGDNTISVIDTTTDKVIATIPVAARPCHVAVHPDGTRVYIAHDLSTGNNISVISTVTNAVIGTIRVGSGPQGLAFSMPNEIIKLLKSAGPDYWAVLGLGGNGTSLSMSGSSSIVGTVANVGVAKTGNVNMSGSSLIQGTLFLNTSGSLNKSGSATVVGGVRKDAATDAVLNQAAADARAASQTAASLPATITSVTSITISNPSQNKTILGGLKTNVLKLTNVAISNGTLTLSAPSGGQFIINISGNFALSGGSKIALSGGLTLYDVLFNFTGTGSVALSGGSTVSGIILAPARQIALSSSFITGAVIAGGSQIASSGGGQINNLEHFKATISAVPILGSAPLQVHFNGIVQGGVPPYTYAWDLDGNGTTDDTRQAFTYTYQQSGIYHVTLRVNDSKGNQVSATAVINATAANRNPIADPGGPYNGSINVPVQFNGSGSSDPDGDPITYSWNFGDVATGSGVNPVHAYASAGTYTVSLTVYDNRGGSGTAQTTAQINSPVPTISSISPSSKTYGDSGFTMTLYGTNFVPGSVVNFNGSVRATTFLSTTQLTASILASDLSAAGAFPITVSNPGPGGGTSNALSFTVNKALPTITVTGGTFAYDGGVHPASATATGVGGATVSGSFSYTYNGLPAEPFNAGSYAVVANFISSDPNYTNATGNGSIVITPANQTISFGALSDKTFDDPPFAVSATASSTLTVSFASQTPLTCSVSGTTVTILDVGVCTIRASQAGNSNYNAATPVDQSFNVTPGALNHFAIGPINSPQTAGIAFPIAITAQDKGNHTATSFTGTVEITSTGILSSGGGTSEPFVNGVLASHSVRILNTGSFTITATRTGGIEAGTSNAFTVNPGALSSFLVEASEGGSLAPQTAGTPFNIRITARDQYNNTVTSFTGTVQITSNGILLGTPLTSDAFVSGVLASQSMTLTSAQLGTTLSATDTVSGANGTSNGFTVNPAGLGNFLVEASAGGSIGPQTAGVPFGIKITARDPYNNVIPSFSGGVTLEAEIGSISPSSVTFYGNEGGSLTVDVTLTQEVAPQTITAISGGHQGSSNDFTVNPAGLGNFLIEASTGGNIAPQTVGAPFGIKITARDAYNNVVTTFSGTVALSTNAGTITPSSVVFTGSEGGVLTTNVTVTWSGVDETITATFDIYGGQSNAFTVNAGPLDHFKVEAAGGGNIPDQAALVSFGIQITAQDAHNNIVTGFNGTVDITSTGNLILGGGTTEAFANGVLASHSVAISAGGSFTIAVIKTGGTETGTSNAFTVMNPVPILSSINPTSITAGSPDFTLTLTGDNFLTTSIVSFNNQQVSYQYISKTQLQATIPASAIAIMGSYPVKITNPAPGGGSTAPLTFAVLNPAPSLTSIDPSSIIAGSPDFTLTLNGDNFSTTSVVSFNNQQYPATFISKNQITATIPATAVTIPGSYPVKVTNPAPGGGDSLPLTFTATQGLQITGFSPTEGPVGTIVTINGFGFDTGNLRVSFNGTSAVVSSFTKTSITTTVPMGSATGPITLTTSGGTATSASVFTVTSLYNFSISIAPQYIKAAPSSQVSYVISATGSDNFSSLISLNIQGLPDGFTALFSPKTITKGQSANLTITTCDCTLSSPAALTISGSSVIDGKTVTQSVVASLEMIVQGETTLTGLILDTDNHPIKGVVVTVGSSSATTDQSGNFLLENPPTGDQVVLMDGFPASTETSHYPTIPITMSIVAGQTNSLPYVPHFHAQKNSNFTPIDPTQDTIAQDPEIPGFELRIPAGVNIIGWDGNPNTKVSIRKVPIDALPVPPPPPDVQVKTVYMFYFGKMGGGVPSTPIPVTVPNDLGLEPGEKANLWYYNESPNLGEAPNEWNIAGTGTVSDDGNTISTDPGVGIPRFCCGAIIWAPQNPTGPNPPPDPCEIGSGGSVEPSTGMFTHKEIDLSLPGRIPITITRYYRNLDSFHGPYGIGTYFSYDWYLLPSGGMAVLTIPPGTRISFTKQADGTYINTNEPMYRGTVVTFNPDQTRTLRMKDGATYKFDQFGLLIEQKDRNGNKLTFLREIEGNVTRIIDNNGRVMVTFNIRIMGRDVITQMTDLTGRKVIYTYNFSADPWTGRLMSVTNPEGGITQYQYDNKGRMTSIIDPRGNTALNVSYDVNGRVCQEQYADGGANKFYYITVAQSTTPAATKLLAEAASGGPISTPLCSAVASNSPIAYTVVVDPNGNPRIYRFNGAQKIISSTDANGQATLTETDPVTNLVKSRTDALGRKTAYTYDSNGNVTSITDPAGNITTMEYDPIVNKPTKITDALSNVTTMTYDSKGNLIQRRTPNSELTTTSYNQYGQPVSVTDPMGNITTSEYDAYGNLVKATDPLGNSSIMQYDALSRLIQSTDARGRTTQYSYDLMNRVTEVKDALNGSTKSTYDLKGNLLSTTDPKGQTTSYTYNSKNQVVSMKDPLGKTETYEYDVKGNLITQTDRKGQITSNSYDNKNRLKRVDYADGSYTENTYDAVGRLIRIYDSISGPIEYEYSNTGCSTGCSGGAMDKVIRETTPPGVITYNYDALGRRTGMTVTGQSTVNYQYDPNSRLLGISTLNSQLGTLNFNIAYDALGRRTSLAYPNGVTTNYTYDNASNLLDLRHLNPLNQILESINYTYDGNGSRTNMQRANAPVRLPDPKSNITFNSANRMLTFDDKSLSYDENGNLTSVTNSCGVTNYSWDARNRLIAINGFTSALTSASTCDPLTASFKYDTLGRRIEKTINGRTIQYLYDGQDIVQEIENGAVSADYIRTLNTDEPLARLTPNALRFYQTDALGSVIALTDETGLIKTQYTYDPFGNVTISGEESDNPFQYTGRENDGTGLYYYRARYYSPQFQRFISEDPIGLIAGINLYAYVANNPANDIDPEGTIVFAPVVIYIVVGAVIVAIIVEDFTSGLHQEGLPPHTPEQEPCDSTPEDPRSRSPEKLPPRPPPKIPGPQRLPERPIRW